MMAHGLLSRFTNVLAGTFDTERNILTPLTPPLKEMLGDKELPFTQMLSSATTLYGSIDGTPVRLEIVDKTPSDANVIVQAFVAQTNKAKYATDFTQLADLATDGVWEWFPALNYEYMSERFWAILGYDYRLMDESPAAWTEKIDPDDSKTAMKMFKEHVNSKGDVPYYATVKYRHKEGKPVHVVCRGTVVDWLPDGSPWRLIGTHTDVTDIVLKDALESREQFVSRMSHEIRSPLCAVLNECDLLGDKYDLTVIKDACSQILYISNDVLSLNRMKAEKMKNDTERCDPEEVISMVIKRQRGEFKKKGIRLSSSVGEVPPEILMDKMKFNQVLDNLMSNALKYTNRGRVSIDCDYNFEKSLLKVTVEDTGIGITEEEREHIFDEFYQGKQSMRGIGIGLYIVKVLCKFMGGYVKVASSTPGEGTTMEFAVRAEVASAAAETEGKSLTTKTLRVLVADDIATNRKYLNRKLSTLEDNIGFAVSEIVEASDGEDAVRVFAKSKDSFDLVLMDCLMPIMDGFDATKKIHDLCDKRGEQRVPVIAVTASIAENIDDMCRSAGIACVITKPFTMAHLKASIEKSMALD